MKRASGALNARREYHDPNLPAVAYITAVCIALVIYRFTVIFYARFIAHPNNDSVVSPSHDSNRLRAVFFLFLTHLFPERPEDEPDPTSAFCA